MLVVAFLQWWYGPGWRDLGNGIAVRLRNVYLHFSVPILLRTLFAPWKRITSVSSGSLGERMRAVLDNAVSRFVGFGVRIVALIAAFCLFLFYGILGVALLLLWPVLPLLGPALIVGGFL